jgi:two-component system sensor kinase
VSGNDPSERENDGIAERTAVYLRALDLHDETGQILTAIMVNLQRLGRGLQAPGAGETIRDTQRLVETLFYSIRDFIRDSSAGAPPAAVPRIELGPALRRLTREFSRRTGMAVELSLDGDAERMSGQHKAVLYRVVQESLTNAFRHSAAGGVIIRFARTGSSVTLEIEDDGRAPRGIVPTRGPRPAAGIPGGKRRAGGGSGLRGMRERVRIVGGECTVEFVEGRGMRISVVLPHNIA